MSRDPVENDEDSAPLPDNDSLRRRWGLGQKPATVAGWTILPGRCTRVVEGTQCDRALSHLGRCWFWSEAVGSFFSDSGNSPPQGDAA